MANLDAGCSGFSESEADCTQFTFLFESPLFSMQLLWCTNVSASFMGVSDNTDLFKRKQNHLKAVLHFRNHLKCHPVMTGNKIELAFCCVDAQLVSPVFFSPFLITPPFQQITAS